MNGKRVRKPVSKIKAEAEKVLAKTQSDIVHKRYALPKDKKMKFADLQRGDAHFINYLQLKQKAGEAITQADSLLKGRFPSEKAKQEAESKSLSYLDIEKKADEYRKKSEFFYKRALTNYTEATTRIAEILTDNKVHRRVFEQQFEKDYIPGGSITSLGELDLDKNTHSTGLGNPIAPEMDYSFEFIDPETPEVGYEQDGPGFDGPGDAGDFPEVEPEDGGIHGPGISLFD